jgi:hypothetical protein
MKAQSREHRAEHQVEDRRRHLMRLIWIPKRWPWPWRLQLARRHDRNHRHALDAMQRNATNIDALPSWEDSAKCLGSKGYYSRAILKDLGSGNDIRHMSAA